VSSIGVVEGTIRVIDDFTATFTKFTTKLSQTEKRAKDLGESLTKAGSKMTKSFTAPLGVLGGLGLKTFADFNDAMSESTSIMGDLSDKMEKDLSKAARQVGKDITGSAKIAAESYFFLSSAGLDAATSVRALPKVATFAKAGILDMAKATDLLTDSQSALGLSVKNDVNQNLENMSRVSDVLVKANTVANASVEQFAQALTTKAGSAMKQLNIEIESGVAVLAAWADQGVKGQLAGEKFNILTRDLQSAFIKNRKAFKDYNIEVFDSQGNFNDLSSIISQLEDSVGTLTPEYQKAALMTLGFTDRSVDATQSLIGLSDQIREYEKDLREAKGTTQEIADKQMRSLLKQMSLLKASFLDAFLVVGESLLPAMLDFKDKVLDPLVGKIGELAEQFTNLSESAQLSIVTFGGLLAAAGPTLLIAGQLAFAWSSIVAVLPGVVTAIGGVITFLVGPGGLVVGLGAAIAAIEPLRNAFVSFVSFLTNSVSTSISDFVRRFNIVWDATKAGRVFIVELAKVISSDLKSALDFVGSRVKLVASAISIMVSEVVKFITQSSVWAAAIDLARIVLDSLASALNTVWDWIKKTKDRVVDWIESMGGFIGIISKVNPALGAAAKVAQDWVLRAKEATEAQLKLSTSTEVVADAAKKTSDVIDDLGDKTGATGGVITSVVKDISSALQDLQSRISEQKEINKLMLEFGINSDIASTAVEVLLSEGGSGLAKEQIIALAKELDDLIARTSKIEKLRDNIEKLQGQVAAAQADATRGTKTIELKPEDFLPTKDEMDETLRSTQKSWERYNTEIESIAAETSSNISQDLVSTIGDGLSTMLADTETFWGRATALGISLFTDMINEQVRRHAQAQIEMAARERTQQGFNFAADSGGGSGGGNPVTSGSSTDTAATAGGAGGSSGAMSAAGAAFAAFVVVEMMRGIEFASQRHAQNNFAGSIRVNDQGTSFDSDLRVSQSEANAIADGIQNVLNAMESATGGFVATLPEIALAVSKSGDRFKVQVGAAASRLFDDIDEAIQFAAASAFQQGGIEGIGESVRLTALAGLANEDTIAMAQELDAAISGVLVGASATAEAFAEFNQRSLGMKELVDAAGIATSTYLQWKNKEVEALTNNARSQLFSIAGITTFGDSLKNALSTYEDARRGHEAHRRELERGLQQAIATEQSLMELNQSQSDLGVTAGITGSTIANASKALITASEGAAGAIGGLTGSIQGDLEAVARLGEQGVRNLGGELDKARKDIIAFNEAIEDIPEAIKASEMTLAIEGAFATLLSDLVDITGNEKARQELARITAQIEIASLQIRAEELLALNRLTQAQVNLLNELVGQATSNINLGRRRRRRSSSRDSGPSQEERDRTSFFEDLNNRETQALEGLRGVMTRLNDEYDGLLEKASQYAEGEERVLRLRDQALREFFDSNVRDRIQRFLGAGAIEGGTRFLSDEDRAGADITEQFRLIMEANDLLIEQENELALARWQINRAEREAFRLLGEDIISQLGLPLEQLRARMSKLSDRMLFLRKQMDAGNISVDRFTDVFQQMMSQAQNELFSLTAGILEQMGMSAEAAALRASLEEANFRMQVIQLNLLFDQYMSMNLLSDEAADRMRNLLNIINDEDNWPDFNFTPVGGSIPGSGGGGFPGGSPADQADSEAQRILDQLASASAEAVNPIEAITNQMDLMREQVMSLRPAFARLGIDFEDVLEDIQALEAARIDEIFNQATQPLIDIQNQLAFGSAEFSGMNLRDQFASNFNRAQELFSRASSSNSNQADRLEAINELSGILPNLIQLGNTVLAPGEQLGDFREFINSVLSGITGFTPDVILPTGTGTGTGSSGTGGNTTTLPQGPTGPIKNLSFFPVQTQQASLVSEVRGMRSDLRQLTGISRAVGESTVSTLESIHRDAITSEDLETSLADNNRNDDRVRRLGSGLQSSIRG
jgi:TP901 family phage tail tape measure protein